MHPWTPARSLSKTVHICWARIAVKVPVRNGQKMVVRLKVLSVHECPCRPLTIEKTGSYTFSRQQPRLWHIHGLIAPDLDASASQLSANVRVDGGPRPGKVDRFQKTDPGVPWATFVRAHRKRPAGSMSYNVANSVWFFPPTPPPQPPCRWE